MSEANRQTQSKDPAFAGTTGADAGSFRIVVRLVDETEAEHLPVSNREPAAWETPARQCRVSKEKGTSPARTPRSILQVLGISLFLIVTAVVFACQSSAQTSARFPGSKSHLVSPDGHYVIHNVDREQEPQHAIFLKDKTTGSSRKVYEYGRGASVVWSPDSRHFAINDHAGSDYTETSIFSVNELDQKIDAQDAIFRFDKRMQNRVTLVGWGHDYFGVVRWLDAERVMVRHWGHNDEPPLGSFCDCYIVTLQGSVAKCAHQPKSDDPEGICRNTTP
jgi:hypothetical protein